MLEAFFITSLLIFALPFLFRIVWFSMKILFWCLMLLMLGSFLMDP